MILMLPLRQTQNFQRHIFFEHQFFVSCADMKNQKRAIGSFWRLNLGIRLRRRSFLNCFRLKMLWIWLLPSSVRAIMQNLLNMLTKLCLFFLLHAQRPNSLKSSCYWQPKTTLLSSRKLDIFSRKMKITWKHYYFVAVHTTI
uniref:DnaJ homolog subfamily C member 3 homolog n=3 Tax=Rhizophora mucronata TaxID=61149 RepID=A0A2P2M078_RHIMU